MKTALAITFAALLAGGMGTALAAPAPSLVRQNMPPAQSMPQQQTGPGQSACPNQFPVFSQLDKSGRGYITKKQAKQVPQLEKDFKKANTSHDGKLTEAEYTAWVEMQCGSGQPLPPPLNWL